MRLAGLLLAMLIGAAGAWHVQNWRYEGRLAELDLAHQADLTAISNAARIQVSQAMDEQRAAEQARADLDAKATQEKANDLAENEKLRRAVDDSTRRLRIAGSCGAGSSNVPSSTSTTGLGNAGTVELAPVAGRTVFDIRTGIIADQAALRMLQKYVGEFCSRGSPQKEQS